MQRRKFLIGMGSLAAGSAAAMGTGAFRSVEANRNVKVDTVGDANAHLKFKSDSEYVTNDNGDKLSIDLGFTGNGHGGRGFNQDAATAIDEVFKIVNQGQDKIEISLDYSGDGKVVSEVDNANLNWGEGVYFEVSDDGGENVIYPGNSTTVDVAVVAKDNDGDLSGGSLTIEANEH